MSTLPINRVLLIQQVVVLKRGYSIAHLEGWQRAGALQRQTILRGLAIPARGTKSAVHFYILHTEILSS